MTIRGRIVDYDTGNGVPGATVELWLRNLMLTRSIADSAGFFVITSSASPDILLASSAGYRQQYWPMPELSETGDFELEKFEKELEGVTVTAGKKKKISWLLVVLGAALLAIISKRK